MGRPRIMIVEDEQIVAMELEEKLQDMGYEVVANLTSGEEALDRLSKVQPSLVLMDIRLDGRMDGVEAADQIRRRQDIPVVYVTAYADDATLQRAKLTEPFGYIVKPFSEKELRGAIETTLYKSVMERRVRESEERYRMLVELMNDGVVLTDKDGLITYANDRLQKLCGLEAAKLVGRFLPELFFGSGKEMCRKQMDILMQGSSGVWEQELRTVRGQSVPVIFSASPIFDPGGPVKGAIGVMTDITERKEAEKALRASEERFRAVIESAEDIVYAKDDSLRFTHVNPALLELVKLPATLVVGRTNNDVLGTDLAGRLTEVEHRVLSGQPVEFEHSLQLRDRSVAFHFIIVPVRDVSGRITGLCGIGRDITERKEREQDLEGRSAPADEYVSEAIKETLTQVRRAARTNSTVLLLGESGSGKDCFARYLHYHSRRARGPFFTINCAALPPELAESELFGHEVGAFTGSAGRKRGLLELAEGGTLLLNEIADLSPKIQAKLLTFLDTHSFARVGGEKNISVDARLVAATNRDLQLEVNRGRFRSDLFYRINVVAITIPPLRERLEDLNVLVKTFMESLSKSMGLRRVPALDPGVLDLLASYDWPGNVRELRNVLERALIHSDRKRITPAQISLKPKALRDEPDLKYTLSLSPGDSLNDALTEAKRHIVQEGLRRTKGSVKETAQMLGLSRDAINYVLRSLNISRPQ